MAETTGRKVCLDLFSGLGGFSSAFEDSDEWDVVTVEIEEEFDPDVCADVLDLRPSDLLDAIGEYDVLVIVASPPCTQFSFAASSLERFIDGEPQTDDAREAVALVYHTMGLIKALSPEWWFMENPQGYLRQVIGAPTGRVTYCQYGRDHMKPTDLWGEHPRSFIYRSCSYGSECHKHNTDVEHGGEGNVREMFLETHGESTAAERSLVPYELSESILEACEESLSGEFSNRVQTALPYDTEGAGS